MFRRAVMMIIIRAIINQVMAQEQALQVQVLALHPKL